MSTYKVAVLDDVKKTAFREVEKREPKDKRWAIRTYRTKISG